MESKNNLKIGLTISKEKYKTDIMMFGVFLMNKVRDAYNKPENIQIVIEDEFKKYEKEYLKNGSLTD